MGKMLCLELMKQGGLSGREGYVGLGLKIKIFSS